jgi:hypothetical protein
LPCGPDKNPLIEAGKTGATRDEDQIRRWWAEFPFAWVGGRTDGLVVLDLDAYKEGHEQDMASLPGEPPETRVHGTLRGGAHLIYLDPDGICRSSKLGKHGTIDVRAGTSHDYIILPSPGNGYEVLRDTPPAHMPPWLPQLLGDRPETRDDTPTELPDPAPLPRHLPAKLTKAMNDPGDDPSEHTKHLAFLACQFDYTNGQIRTLLEHDLTTTARREDPKHAQSGWWPAEFWRVVNWARDEVAQKMRSSGAAAVLMTLANDNYEFGIADDGEPYALPRTGPLVVRMLRGDKYSLRAELSHRYHELHGAPPSNGAIADVLVALEGQSQLSDPVPLPLRVARHGDELVLDLGDRTGRAVVIGAGGWDVVDRSPVLFRRTRLTAALPDPVRGGKLTTSLLPFINVSKDDWPLLAACLVSMLWPDIPHPIPHLTGTEGVAKTATTRTLRSLMDPSSVATRGKPEEKDWDVALASQWIVALDNLSTIPPWLSDALCRAVTGEGAVRRKLYTDSDMSMIAVRRVMMLNGISTEISNADLAGRTITFELEAIKAYRDETDLAREWQAAHPLALGALLDMAAAALKAAPDVALDPIYRMADFARITAALDKINGTNALETYRQRLENSARDVLHLDAVGTAIIEFMTGRDAWDGMWSDLENELRRYAGTKSPGWPKGPVAWGTKLKRIGNPLQRAGIQVVKEHTRLGARYFITRA